MGFSPSSCEMVDKSAGRFAPLYHGSCYAVWLQRRSQMIGWGGLRVFTPLKKAAAEERGSKREGELGRPCKKQKRGEPFKKHHEPKWRDLLVFIHWWECQTANGKPQSKNFKCWSRSCLLSYSIYSILLASSVWIIYKISCRQNMVAKQAAVTSIRAVIIHINFWSCWSKISIYTTEQWGHKK